MSSKRRNLSALVFFFKKVNLIRNLIPCINKAYVCMYIFRRFHVMFVARPRERALFVTICFPVSKTCFFITMYT